MKTPTRTCSLLLPLAFAVSSVFAGPGDWRQVGKPGAWALTIAGATLGGNLYTVESSGALYVTSPATGQWRQIGKNEFGNTMFMFAGASYLYTIETDGSLYEVHPNDGTWRRLGKAGEWKLTIAGTVIGDRLYTVENTGNLYETDLSSGVWRQIGKAEFAATRFMTAIGGMLYTIETSGSLYRVNPSNGSWVQVGKSGAWVKTIAAVGGPARLYTVESDGVLYETDPANGVWNMMGKPEFVNTRFMFCIGDLLYTIEKDGSLYEVKTR